MKNIEYTKMAYLYDRFYANKDYSKEVEFIKSFIENKDYKILDAGCGTGNHAKQLFDFGYDIFGFDQSQDMVDIANEKIENRFFVGDILNVSCKEKYGLIISFFAVFNHLKNYKEFKKALLNLKSMIKDGGTIIIDLHNPQKNGKKTETVQTATRIMRWKKCELLKKEFTNITYILDGEKFQTKHTFKIFDMVRLKKIARKVGFSATHFYENYDMTKPASKESKNIQMVLSL